MTSGVLVLVTGTGRSGTSTVSGALHNLGLFVPGPYLNANASNPKGFYESRWAVTFHQKLLRAAELQDFDARPYAFERAQAQITPEVRAELVSWLTEQAAIDDQVVVKDPRSVWVQRLWGEAADEAGLDIRYLSMLRHPAETMGSRTAAYAKNADALQRRRYQTFSLARWLNNSLLSERETRGSRRAFVPYAALVEDWRSTLATVRDELGLTFQGDLTPGVHHEVDDFVDPDLRRVRITWDELAVPGELREMAQSVWDDLLILREARGDLPDVSTRFDRVSVDYERLFADAAAVAHDAMEESSHAGRRQGAGEARKEMARRRKERVRARAAAEKQWPDPETAATPDRLVRDVTSLEILRTVGGRVWRRLPRRARRP